MAVAFDNIINFRDVGKTINDHVGRKIVREGVIYRSARPDDATQDDRKKLTEELGIRTVMDLRSKTEHAKQASKRQADLQVPALLQSNAALAEPVQIPGLRYLKVRVTGSRFERFLLGQLGWLSFLKLIFFYVSGYRMQAVGILGREVMQPRGLVGVGLVSMDESGGEIAEGLRAFIEPASLPILVHCTQGKDRTGLIISLVLMALGVSAEAISHDYLLSQEGLEAEKEVRLAEIRELGLTPDWGDCPRDFVSRVEEHIINKYGGIDGYLDSIGFTSAERQRLVEVLGV